ncbi:MAG: glycosyltransferase [Gemmataceae bacterium]|nr:glycosyltransferase [Gemmataceae bacterium]
MPPAVSVLIPAYNGAPWLRACLESVRGQTYPVHEIIVVDDGSTDDTRAVLHPFAPHITLLAQQRGGIGAARNRAVAHASGELLAFLDQDDLWRPDKLEKQVRYAVGRQDVAVIYTDAEEFDDGGTVHPSFFDLFPGLRTSGDLFGPLIDRCIPLMSTTLIRAAFLRAYGLSFFEPASGVDDVGLFLEVCVRGGKFGRLDEPLTRRRLHPNNTSKNHYNRFARRIVLYEELLRRLPEASATHRRELRRGLRDAHFRVGECAWGDLDLTQARQHFRRALGPEAHGARALLCLALSYLPRRALRGLRAVKQRIAPALTTSR